ncbi:hypothetical protein ILUMI_20962 [Ignelater luminosus]|uniref:Uncharacterized protein n=1 Tax=Ignelater luminosus TaxID=2038154 RepID=A0A8K0CHF6_IGNLU|nr:hypothetical protein ILUMI_20962 [Ignelater luminosus]
MPKINEEEILCALQSMKANKTPGDDEILMEMIKEDNKTKVVDVAKRRTYSKWNYAGRVARIKDNRWSVRILGWRPWTGKRDRGSPITRWYDDIEKVTGLPWIRVAQGKDRWGAINAKREENKRLCQNINI